MSPEPSFRSCSWVSLLTAIAESGIKQAFDSLKDAKGVVQKVWLPDVAVSTMGSASRISHPHLVSGTSGIFWRTRATSWRTRSYLSTVAGAQILDNYPDELDCWATRDQAAMDRSGSRALVQTVFFFENPRTKKSWGNPPFLDLLGKFIFFVPDFSKKSKNVQEIFKSFLLFHKKSGLVKSQNEKVSF